MGWVGWFVWFKILYSVNLCQNCAHFSLIYFKHTYIWNLLVLWHFFSSVSFSFRCWKHLHSTVTQCIWVHFHFFFCQFLQIGTACMLFCFLSCKKMTLIEKTGKNEYFRVCWKYSHSLWFWHYLQSRQKSDKVKVYQYSFLINLTEVDIHYISIIKKAPVWNCTTLPSHKMAKIRYFW